MFKTLKEGLNKPKIQLKKINKKFIKIYKKNAKKLVTLSVIFKLVLFSMPMIVLPAYAQSETSAKNSDSITLELSKNDLVFNAPKKMEIKIGASNNELTKKAVQKTTTAYIPNVKQPDLSLEELRAMYKQVENYFGVPGLAQAVESVHQLESGKSNSTSIRSASGAVGPAQFLPSTFAHYCIPDVGCNITDLKSSLYAAGNLLAKSYEWKGTWQGAFLNYNHSLAYANRAVSIMQGI